MPLPKSFGIAAGWPRGGGQAIVATIAPGFTAAPAITGTAQVGQILTASTGTVTGTAPITYAYQWKSNGSNVGTNANTYTPVSGDVGNTITVTVTATNAAGSASSTSSATAAVIAAATGPLTSLPQSAAVISDANPDKVIGSVANGSEVTSLADPTSGITATAPAGSGPTLATGVANGHAALRAATKGKYLSLGRPAALATAMATADNWSVLIVYRNPGNTGSSYSSMFGDLVTQVSASGFTLGASSTGANLPNGNVVNRTFSTGDPASNVHTMIYSGEGNGVKGRQFQDGTMFFAPTSLKIGSNSDPLYIGNALTSTGGSIDGSRGFVGDILRVIVFNTALSPAEAWQADCWARNTYGKALATAGLTFFTVFDGDSQTFGTGATPDTATPVVCANTMGWKQGQFANVGKPSAKMQAGSGAGNNLTDHAARDVDGFRTVTGLPIVLVAGEWYNQGVGQTTSSAGLLCADYNRTYAQQRKAADPTARLVMWTSLASGMAQGAPRDAFDASLVSSPGPYIDAIIPVHTDPNIGVDGALGTSGAPNTAVTADAIHLNSGGTPYHAALIVPQLYR